MSREPSYFRTRQVDRTIQFTIALLLLVAGAGCRGRSSELSRIYNRAATHHDAFRNPVIVIPGIMGSKLTDSETKTIVWGAFSGQYANQQTHEGIRLFSLPMQLGTPLAELRDGVSPAGSLDQVDINLLGLPVSLKAYRDILLTLGVGGYRDELLGQSGAIDYGNDHYTCFQFDYDWRRDNVENARRLHEFILQKRAYVTSELQERYGVINQDVKFDIVAHSMGGLVARYFLRYGDADLPENGTIAVPTWAGAKFVDNAILVGTPNAGAIDSLEYLINGRSFAPFIPKYSSVALGTMPAIYQLLPRPRHRAVVTQRDAEPIDFLDVNVWKENRWGLANPDADTSLRKLLPENESADRRNAIALDHLHKCLRRARRFFEAIDRPAPQPPNLRIHLFAGDAIATAAQGVSDLKTGQFKIVDYQPGDGTVTRASTLMDERLDGAWSPRLRSPIEWQSVQFLFKSHLGMTQDAAFADNVLFLLLEL